MTTRLEQAISAVNSGVVTSLQAALEDDSARLLKAVDETVAAIRYRDAVILDESDYTPECIGQLMGGN